MRGNGKSHFPFPSLKMPRRAFLEVPKRTRTFAGGKRVTAFQGFKKQAEKRLEILNAADSLNDLAVLPSNRFEALSGDRQGQYSIRINRQWRICFEWPGNGPENVEITDYH